MTALPSHHFTVVCSCGTQRAFRGDRMGDVFAAEEHAGWTHGLDHPIGATVFHGTCADCRSWPNRCQTCRGWGVTTFQQSVPYGSTSASFDVTDPCEACTANGNCARCGEPGLTSEDRGDDTTGDGPCKFCSWNYEDGLPEEPYDDGSAPDDYDKPEGPLSIAGRRAWEGTD